MKKLQIISGWVFVVLGMLHTVVGFIQYDSLSEKTLWFFSAGITLCFAGIINFMQVAAADNKNVGIFSIISNSVMTIYVLTFGYQTMKKNIMNPMA